MKIEEVENFLLNKEQNLKQIVVSDKLNGEINKIIIKPTKIKNKLVYQVATFKNNQVFHTNLDYKSAINALQIKNFKQILCENIGSSATFSISKNGYKFHEKPNEILPKDINTDHNKQKNYLINEGDNVPILQELGIFTKENKIVNKMYDKFKQINRFIEIIDDEFKNSNLKEITILDFGCGKSYLTFLIYHYFVNLKKIKQKYNFNQKLYSFFENF